MHVRRSSLGAVPVAVLVAATVLLAVGAGAGAASRPRTTIPRDVTTVNGEVPPGLPTAAETTLLFRQKVGAGKVLYQYRTVRQPGTRAPIHVHPSGGSTCVVEGETTMRIEGTPGATTTRAGECVFMPPGPIMVNFNSGSIPFVAIDTFVLGRGEKPLSVVEPGHAHVEHEYDR